MLEVNFLGKRNINKKNRKVNMMKKESNHEKDSNQKDLTVEQGKPNELSDKQKEELQVNDGQNDHHVDERGGN
ncbi:hypothetical protein SAMN04487786_3963 [Paenisporosarcina quisquiliarum]|nr:hypothetical protein SAMN04487786_3963 [Paenisporosarcina quisquiliarum]